MHVASNSNGGSASPSFSCGVLQLIDDDYHRSASTDEGDLGAFSLALLLLCYEWHCRRV
jgi:hypothetical protein